jgi:hypothetical protein
MTSTAQKREPNWVKLASLHFPSVDRVEGTGPYAFVTACRPEFVYVSLWDTQEEAEHKKASIDRFGCGGRCRSDRRHCGTGFLMCANRQSHGHQKTMGIHPGMHTVQISQ